MTVTGYDVCRWMNVPPWVVGLPWVKPADMRRYDRRRRARRRRNRR